MHDGQRTRTAAAPRLRAVVAAALVVGALAAVAVMTAQASAAPARGTVVGLRSTGLGRVLADARGRTLYLFEKDTRTGSACSGTCATYWPPLITKAKPRAGKGVLASLLGTVRRADKRLQVTYGGHPLYLFALDRRAGDVKGEGLDDFGAEWYVLSAKGKKVEQGGGAASQGTGATSGSSGSDTGGGSSGGGGYNYGYGG